jgi:hypothetical protein
VAGIRYGTKTQELNDCVPELMRGSTRVQLLGTPDSAFVDDEDARRVLEAGPWIQAIHRSPIFIARPGYPVRPVYAVQEPRGSQTPQELHRFILGITDPNILVVHSNECGLDCRKENLSIPKG